MKTIAELWGEANDLIRLSIPHLEKLSSPDYMVDEAMRPIYRGQLDSCHERLGKIRAELLERCGNDLEMTILKTEFHGWAIRYDTSYIDKFYTKERALKIAAAMQFMAWELEQRENEAKRPS